MNMPSTQQEFFYRALARRCDLTVIYSGTISLERKQLGWDVEPHGYNYSFQSPLSLLRINKLETGVFHFLSGLPGGFLNLKRILSSTPHTKLGVQTEMRTSEDQTVRRALQSVLYARLLKWKHIPCFAIGKRMYGYFQRLGIPAEHIFPYGYFGPEPGERGGKYEGPLLFVGQFVLRKRVDVLLRAYSLSEQSRFRKLILVGDGPERENLERLSDDLEVRSQVDFIGSVGNARIRSLMNKASVLLLPSSHDGWGFVVNEAISIGLPVIVSDRCGVADVVCRRCVVPAGDAVVLAKTIDDVVRSHQIWETFSNEACEAHATISSESGARYFLDIIEFINSRYTSERPQLPWMLQLATHEKIAS